LRRPDNTDELFTVRSMEEPLWHGVETAGNPCHAVRLSFQYTTGWIMGSWSGEENLVRLCWLPAERRGLIYAVWGSTMVIGAQTGTVTILNLSALLVMFDHGCV
jgi:hypothetical protein